MLAVMTDASGGSTHSSIGEQKVTLVFFLGGVTFAEVSALRFLAQLEDGNFCLCDATCYCKCLYFVTYCLLILHVVD